MSHAYVVGFFKLQAPSAESIIPMAIWSPLGSLGFPNPLDFLSFLFFFCSHEIAFLLEKSFQKVTAPGIYF